jgi:hypothetical protein
MIEQSLAFPHKTHFDQYKPLIDAALAAAIGSDKLPKVVAEDYENAQLAMKAANAIRNHVRSNALHLRVSCPESSKTVYLYKTDTPPRTRKKKNVIDSAAPEAPEE